MTFKTSKITSYVLAGLCLLLLGMVIPSRVRSQVEYSSPVREVEKPARSPFFFECSLFLTNGGSTNRCDFNVPAGQRLVIENIRGEVDIPAGQRFGVIFSATQVAGTASGSNSFSGFDLPASFEGNFGSDRYAINQLTRIYLDASTSSNFLTFFRNSTAGFADAFLEVNGYLIAVP